MSFFLKHMANNLWHGKFSFLPEDLAIHAVSARLGGVSKAPFASLNLGLHVGDDAAAVLRNREIFASSLSFRARDIVTAEQVHGTRVERVGEAERGRGAVSYEDALPGVDALITDEPGLPLMLCFADCVPLLFVDPDRPAVGIAHAGRRGTLGHIAQKTLEAMAQEFATVPGHCIVAIGPSIGPCCYEVGKTALEECKSAFPGDWQRLLRPQEDGSSHLDLWEANRLDLMAAGVDPANIDCAAECTCCKSNWFYSYRKEGGETGRIGAIIALRKY